MIRYKDGEFKHGKLINILKKLLDKHPDFKIKSEWIEKDTGKISGYITYNSKADKDIYVGTKRKIFRLASINEDAYVFCKNENMDIGVLFFEDYDGLPFKEKKPRMYIFDIGEIMRDSETGINKRVSYNVASNMVDFKMRLGKRYQKYILNTDNLIASDIKEPGIYCVQEEFFKDIN